MIEILHMCMFKFIAMKFQYHDFFKSICG